MDHLGAAMIAFGLALGGGAIGAAIANVHHPWSFQVLFLANAASCLLFAGVAARLPSVRAPRGRQGPGAGYRDVLAHRGLRTVMIATVMLAFTGYWLEAARISATSSRPRPRSSPGCARETSSSSPATSRGGTAARGSDSSGPR